MKRILITGPDDTPVIMDQTFTDAGKPISHPLITDRVVSAAFGTGISPDAMRVALVSALPEILRPIREAVWLYRTTEDPLAWARLAELIGLKDGEQQ